MADYIEREAAIICLLMLEHEFSNATVSDALTEIKNIPTTNPLPLVDVVRCRYCKYFSEYIQKCDHPLGLIGCVDKDGFCSYGERGVVNYE